MISNNTLQGGMMQQRQRISPRFYFFSPVRAFIRNHCFLTPILPLVLAALFTLLVAPAFAERKDFEQDKNKSVVIFYLDEQYSPVVKLERLGKVSDGMKAILAMYAFQIGGGCKGHDVGGLNCELTRALGLGSQCSRQHLSLIRTWFKKDIPSMSGYPEQTIQRALKSGDLESICYNAPYTATRQVIWEIIRVSESGDRVYVDAISNWTASADGPSGRDRYQTELQIAAGAISVVAHKKTTLPQRNQ